MFVLSTKWRIEIASQSETILANMRLKESKISISYDLTNVLIHFTFSPVVNANSIPRDMTSHRV